jgi:hypothetical protein
MMVNRFYKNREKGEHDPDGAVIRLPGRTDTSIGIWSTYE